MLIIGMGLHQLWTSKRAPAGFQGDNLAVSELGAAGVKCHPHATCNVRLCGIRAQEILRGTSHGVQQCYTQCCGQLVRKSVRFLISTCLS